MHRNENELFLEFCCGYFRSDALLEDGSGVVAHPRYDIEERPIEALKLPYNATVTPLQVHLPSAPPRPPTLAECEVIMKHMQQTNERQAHEVILFSCLCIR